MLGGLSVSKLIVSCSPILTFAASVAGVREKKTNYRYNQIKQFTYSWNFYTTVTLY